MDPRIADLFLSPRPAVEPEPVRAFTVRIPVTTMQYLEELTERANISRMAMATNIMQWGIEYALQQMPTQMHVAIVEEVEGQEAADQAAAGRAFG